MRFRLGAALAFALLAVGACERGDDRSPSRIGAETEAFRHELSDDVSGEYRPVADGGPVKSLFIGQTSAFEAWEAGNRAASPLILTLTGRNGEMRVAPRTYLVTDDGVRMAGATPDGDVTFRARIDQDALATARRNLGDHAVVISGTLQVGDKREPIALAAWDGD